MSTIRPKRSLGQNFLVDPNTARRIVDALAVPTGGQVVEIGPGTGAITSLLLARHPQLIAVEIDQRAVQALTEQFPDLDVRHQDVLDIDWKALAGQGGSRLHVIGNLPYHITSPILFSLFENTSFVAEAVIMMQLEVAERLIAKPRTKPYGILSVATQLVGRAEILFRVSRNVFRPRPNVTSAVVRLTFPQEPSGVEYSGRLREVVRAAFNQRRKKLRNSLAAVAESAGVEVPDRWSNRRAEELVPEEFVELTRYLTR
ncbi:MAG: ribosomal RNA small subunit methyltransferase A [Rhodothermales bacterium]|nr:ribosomal RNA small subunit methyltransferase A [Rhodothermales bacterium]